MASTLGIAALYVFLADAFHLCALYIADFQTRIIFASISSDFGMA
jgi:hypothetical protein